jgi:hypothetical protein
VRWRDDWRTWFVSALCAYEFVALVPGSRLPTITSLVHHNRAHSHPARRLLAVGGSLAGLTWAFHHLLVEKPHSNKTRSLAGTPTIETTP